MQKAICEQRGGEFVFVRFLTDEEVNYLEPKTEEENSEEEEEKEGEDG